jgi:hypothetical protein
VPSTTALHMLPVLPTIELVIAPVSASTEFVTLEEVLELVELVMLVELLESEEMFWADTDMHSPRAAIVRRCLISQCSNVLSCWHC